MRTIRSISRALGIFTLLATPMGCTSAEVPAQPEPAKASARGVVWEKDLAGARRRAALEKKLVLLDFYDPMCSGCRQLERVTYQDGAVLVTIEREFVPVLVSWKESPLLAKQYEAAFTPTIVILTPDGRTHASSTGYLPPREFLAYVALGRGKALLSEGRTDEAAAALAEVPQQWPETASAPEALYWRGIALYRRSGQATDLTAAWTRLRDAYPDSIWTKKCSFPIEGAPLEVSEDSGTRPAAR